MAHELDNVNLTELIQMARSAGLGNVGRNLPREDIIAMLEGTRKPKVDPIEPQRVRMEAHIRKHFQSLRTQLPCPQGRCTTFGCPDIIVQRCWAGFKDHIL